MSRAAKLIREAFRGALQKGDELVEAQRAALRRGDARALDQAAAPIAEALLEDMREHFTDEEWAQVQEELRRRREGA